MEITNISAIFTDIDYKFLKKRFTQFNPEINDDTTTQKPSENSLHKQKSKNIDHDFLKKTHQEETIEAIIGSLEDETEYYNKLDVLADTGRAKFWKNTHHKLPRLEKLVKRVCCGTAATVKRFLRGFEFFLKLTNHAQIVNLIFSLQLIFIFIIYVLPFNI